MSFQLGSKEDPGKITFGSVVQKSSRPGIDWGFRRLERRVCKVNGVVEGDHDAPRRSGRRRLLLPRATFCSSGSGTSNAGVLCGDREVPDEPWHDRCISLSLIFDWTLPASSADSTVGSRPAATLLISPDNPKSLTELRMIKQLKEAQEDQR